MSCNCAFQDIEGDLSENLKKEESSSEKEELAIDETTEVKEPGW